jgi:hypothetical protein
VTTNSTPDSVNSSVEAGEDAAADFMAAPLAETPRLDAGNPIQFDLMSRMKHCWLVIL